MQKKFEELAEKYLSILEERLESLDMRNYSSGMLNHIPPMNIRGNVYRGINRSFLTFYTMITQSKLPIFATFNQIKSLQLRINKGATSVPVMYAEPIIENRDNPAIRISESKYLSLSEEEKLSYKFSYFARAYNVFDLSIDTDLLTKHPEILEKYKNTDTYSSSILDETISKQEWICPIKIQSEFCTPCYNKATDIIKIPEMSFFVENKNFYKDLLHEMAHSTGHETRLDRFSSNEKNALNIEEGVAELSSSIMANTLGISEGIEENSLLYLKSWLDNINDRKKNFMKIMLQTGAACNYMSDKLKLEQKIGLDLDKYLTEKIENSKGKTLNHSNPTPKL